jgi:hypothetical protein
VVFQLILKDARTTMKYSHVISEDGRKIAARFREPSSATGIAVRVNLEFIDRFGREAASSIDHPSNFPASQ